MSNISTYLLGKTVKFFHPEHDEVSGTVCGVFCDSNGDCPEVWFLVDWRESSISRFFEIKATDCWRE